MVAFRALARAVVAAQVAALVTRQKVAVLCLVSAKAKPPMDLGESVSRSARQELALQASVQASRRLGPPQVQAPPIRAQQPQGPEQQRAMRMAQQSELEPQASLRLAPGARAEVRRVRRPASSARPWPLRPSSLSRP